MEDSVAAGRTDTLRGISTSSTVFYFAERTSIDVYGGTATDLDRPTRPRPCRALLAEWAMGIANRARRVSGLQYQLAGAHALEGSRVAAPGSTSTTLPVSRRPARVSRALRDVPRDHLAEIVARATAVNSMHHQGIRDLARGLVVSATAPDGLIEAIELPGDDFVLAVQWTPEALTEKDPLTRRLFEAFTTAARDHRREREASGSIA